MSAGDDAVSGASAAPVSGGAPVPPAESAESAESAGSGHSQVAVRGGSAVAAQQGDADRPAPDGAPVPARPVAPVRRDARVSKPARHPQWLVNQLPVGMLNSDFFVRFVSLFQELAGTLLDDADQIVHVPDATVTPVPMVGHLASWIGAETVDPSLPEALQRLILRSSAKALAHRGTRQGLVGYLQMLSGGDARVTDGGGVWIEGESPDDPAWVRMEVDGTGHLSEDEFVALIRDEIPAHVRAELFVAGRRVLCTEEEK